MAEEKKKSYPKIPKANWFDIRDRFKQKTPAEVTASYLASVLNIGPASAANLIPPLKTLGLIGSDNKPTDLAFDWRDDASYAGACRTMLDATYPAELLDLFHEPGASLQSVSNWFSRHTRSGQAASTACAAMYLLLLEGDLAKRDAAKAKNGGGADAKPKPATKAAVRAKVVSTPPQIKQPDVAEIKHEEKKGFSPKLHVDIQIHISPDSSPEQIDKIFESMAKHLPLKG